MVRTFLVPTIMTCRLIGPRLMVMRFRGAQRNLTVLSAHPPHAGASEGEREDFYTDPVARRIYRDYVRELLNRGGDMEARDKVMQGSAP